MLKIVLDIQEKPRCFEEQYSIFLIHKTLKKLFGKEAFAEKGEPLKKGTWVLLISSLDVAIPETTKEVVESVIKENKSSVFSPSYNASPSQGQTNTPPNPYTTLGTFNETSRGLWLKFGTETARSGEPFLKDILLFKTERELNLEDLRSFAGGVKEVEIIKGWYVHKYGEEGFSSYRKDLVDLIPPNAECILDVGAGGGGLGRYLKKLKPEIKTFAVEPNPFFFRMCQETYDKAANCKIEEFTPDIQFDVVIMGDVLEHLYDPWDALRKVYTLLKRNGALILSTPNVRHWSILEEILKNGFRYTPWGPMSVTHIRFFTKEDLMDLLEEVGFKIEVFESLKIPIPQNRQLPFPPDDEYEFIVKAVKP